MFYRNAMLTESQYGYPAIEYKRSVNNVWLPTMLTGTTFTENIVQATARDVLVDGILRLEQAGASVRFHVHDKIVAEGLPEKEVKEILQIPPSWAKDLIVKVESATSKRYRKI